MKAFFLAIALFAGAAQAKTVTFDCEWRGWDVAFSTDVDDQAVEVRRAYEWDSRTTFYFRIPLVGDEGTWADVQVSEGRKTVNDRAYCIRSAQ